MPKTRTGRQLHAVIPLHSGASGVVKEEAKRRGSITASVRGILDDPRTLYGLPQLQVELLETDMKNLKLTSYRDYVRHLLSMRLQTLLQQRGSNRRGVKQ